MIAKGFLVSLHGWKKKALVTLLLIGVCIGLVSGSRVLLSSNVVQKPTPTSSSNVVYGVNVDITAMIPGTRYTVRTASGGNFFDLAAQLGINTLRITDIRWAMTGNERSRATWQRVFNEAEQHHIRIILLLIDGGEHSAVKEAHTLLDNYGLAHAPALWMVDLYNEPDVSDPQQITELQAEATYIHQVAPKVPVTIGGWKSEVPGHPGTFNWQDPADIPKLISLVDVVSPHLYEFEQGAQQGFTPQEWTRSFLTAVRQEAQGKPILIEEFGAGNGLATTTESTPTGSPQWQASVYRGVLQEVSAEHDRGVMGAVAWIIVPRPAWPGSLEGDMTGWAFVLNHGRHLLPAAEEYRTVGHATQTNQLPA